jgi:hypothetical protein
MVWILIAAAVVFMMANLPLVYALHRFDRRTMYDLWRLAPNQFLFDFLFVPASVVAVGCALYWVVSAAQKAPEAASSAALSQALRNWPVLILLGIALSALVSAAFYVSSAWSPDKLQTPYGAEVTSSIHAAEADRSATLAAKDGERKWAAALREADAQSGLANLTPSDAETQIPQLKPLERLHVLMSKGEQERLQLLSPTATALSVFQVFAVLVVAALALETSVILVAVSRSTSITPASADLGTARFALTVAIACYLPYPYLFGMYRSEIERVTDLPNSGAQDVIAMLVVMTAAVLVYISEGDFSISSASTVRLGLVAAFALLPTIAERGGFTGAMRSIVGVNANIGVQLVVAILFVFAFALAFLRMRVPG